jgi:hypothetical protein
MAAAYRIKSRRLKRPTQSARRFDDGREVCLANSEGRSRYNGIKQDLWERQGGRCAWDGCLVADQRVSLSEARLTGGDWEESQQRDDRIEDGTGRQINFLVHKVCLRGWHLARTGSGISWE